jgi:hypothetical protein
VIEQSFPTSPHKPPLERTASLARPEVAEFSARREQKTSETITRPIPAARPGSSQTSPKEPDHKPKPRNERTVLSLDQLFTTGEFITIDSTGKL